MPQDRWFELSEVNDWRRRLRTEYRRGTLRYLKVKRPDLVTSEDVRKLSKQALEEAVRSGRAGHRLAFGEERLTTYVTKRRLKMLQRRNRLSDALDALLQEKPLREITVREVLHKSNRSRYSFYTAFKSGLLGLYCYWAAGELDTLTQSAHQRIIMDIRVKKSPKKILQDWVSIVSGFIMERPYGRLPIVIFLIYEIDSIGSALAWQLRGKSGETLRKQNAVIDEFASLAADFHRAGARVIHELESLFLHPRYSLARRSKLARGLWEQEEAASWNLAVSFWQTVFTSVFAVGVMEAEREVEHYRSLIFEAWYKGTIR